MASTTYGDVLARNIRAARSRKGLNQESLAVRMRSLGYSAWLRQTVANVEKCKRRVIAEEIFGLAFALETSIGALMDPSTDDESLEFPSGHNITVMSVLRSVRHFNDGYVYWEADDIPVIGYTERHRARMESDLPDLTERMEPITNFTPEMMRERNARLEPPSSDPPMPPPRRQREEQGPADGTR